MNQALCNKCKKLVPAISVERKDKVYLVKDCRECGKTETLISADLERYNSKRGIDSGHKPKPCALDCLECGHHNSPALLFLDITNRCNMNCSICINNTPSMGYVYNPPLDYFEKIFKHFSQLEPKPAVQLFGGEPTMREDLFDIINLAKSYGLRPRVVTNGLKLADEDFCRRLVETQVKILFAYDGNNPELYKDLRGSDRSLKIKLQALENIRKIGQGRVTLMTLVSKDYNAEELPEFFKFCHERRDYIGSIYFMPLAHTWDAADWEYAPEQMTTEDVELIIDKAFPDDPIEFLPAGLQGQMPTFQRCLRIKPLPFMGAHPNCESIYIMISNGEEYVPFTRHFKKSPMDAIHALKRAEKELARRVKALDEGVFGRLLDKCGLKRPALYLLGMASASRALRKHVDLGSYLQGRGIGKLYHAMVMPLQLAFGGKSVKVVKRHTTVHSVLEILVLPFEDPHNIETDRLERCPAAFAYIDPRTDKVESVPTCAWTTMHKKKMMRMIAEKFGTVKEPGEKIAVAREASAEEASV